MSGDEDRLRRLLGGPDTAWIVQRARTRLSRGQALTGPITLNGATEPQRVAVGRLLGRTVGAGRSVSVPLERVDDVLRSSGAWPEGLASAVIALAGPVEDPGRRQAEKDAWRAVNTRLADLANERPELTGWADGVRSRGHLKRVAADAGDALDMVDDLRAVVTALPTARESLAGFAARVLHRAHALDVGTPLGNLAVSAAEAMGHTRSTAVERPAPTPSSAAWRRAVWASVGVLVDDLSSTVLVLNLPGASPASAFGSPTSAALTSLAESGEPAVLTLRQVVSDSLGAVSPLVSVCENPAVVSAAADRLGASSSPLVCLQGQPGAAAVTLLRRLRDDGASLRLHADFDWGGVTIAGTLAAQVDWTPWRFRTSDYLDALGRHERAEGPPGLSGRRVDTPWDPSLASAMVEHGVRVEEELVLDELLGDLRI